MLFFRFVGLGRERKSVCFFFFLVARPVTTPMFLHKIHGVINVLILYDVAYLLISKPEKTEVLSWRV